MTLRFRRRLSILPGLSLNLSRRGASVSAGARGARVSLGSAGTRATVGIPGSGLSYTATATGAPRAGRGAAHGTLAGLLALALLAYAVWHAIVG